MGRLPRCIHYCCCAVLPHLGIVVGISWGQAAIYMVPAGEDPNAFGDGPTVIDASGLGGQSIDIEFFIRGAPVPVRGFAEDVTCRNVKKNRGSIDYILGSGAVNQFRRDFIFFQSANQASASRALMSCGIDVSTCPDGTVRFACGRNSQATDISDGLPRYAGEFVLSISPDACGEFIFPFVGGSGLADRESQVIPADLRELIITVGPPMNDFSTNAELVWDGALDLDTRCASTDGPKGCPVEADVWYFWTASCTGTLVVDAPGARIGVYSPNPLGAPTDAHELACSLDTSNTIDVRPGETYLIRVGTPDGAPLVGTLNIDVQPAQRYGDLAGANAACGPDGVVDLNDILAMLNGFTGVFVGGCELEDLDIARPRIPTMNPGAACEPDGRIGLFDILAIIDAFQGTDRCCGNP